MSLSFKLNLQGNLQHEGIDFHMGPVVFRVVQRSDYEYGIFFANAQPFSQNMRRKFKICHFRPFLTQPERVMECCDSLQIFCTITTIILEYTIEVSQMYDNFILLKKNSKRWIELSSLYNYVYMGTTNNIMQQ